jgi:hypothetical protein
MKAFGIRRVALSFLIALAVPLAAAAATHPAGSVVYEDRFDVRDLSWSRDAKGDAFPVFGQLRGIDDPGQPRLPLHTLLLLVPADAVVENAWIEPLATHLEKVDGALAVGEPLITDTGDILTKARLEAAGGVYPAAWGRFDGTHTWRGYRLLAVEVFPMRSTATAGEVEFLDSYAVRVSYGKGAPADDVAVRERLVPAEREANLAVLADLVANPAELNGYDRQDGAAAVGSDGGFNPDKTPSLSGSAVNFLIVTNEAMRPAFEVLAAHKTAQGIPTVVATREYIEANYRRGADFQETLRMYIRDAYQKWGVDYVMLAGDSDILPPRYVMSNFYPVNGWTAIPCDLYFACLDGNWNADGDDEFGEPLTGTSPGDAADFAEEVYLGRAAVSTLGAATTFVNKVIAYESTAAGAGWTNRTLFAAEVLFPEDYGHGSNFITLDGAKFAHEQVTNSIVPCTGMEYKRMYETNVGYPWDAPLSRAALIDSLNTGHYGIFNQIGHGYYFNMSVADANFMTTDADNLTNNGHSFLMYALNCASAAFDNSCLLERFVQNPHGGAICSLGSVRAAFPNNANNYQQEFFGKLYCTSENRVGRLLALSRLPFIGLTTNNYTDRWTFENYTLLGDPSLPVWTSAPKAVVVSGTNSLTVGPQVVNATVTVAGVPFAGATVCVQKGAEDLAYGVTDALGHVSLPVLPTSIGTVTMKVSGRNLALTTRSLPVTSGSAYLAVESVVIHDDGTDGSSGNGDGLIDAGETVALRPVLRETGGSAAGAAASTVSTSAPLVTVPTPGAGFAAVAAGGSTAALTPMLVYVDSAVADATPVVFSFDTVVGSSHYTSEWTAMVHAPQLEVVSLDWEDVTWGNGDGGLGTGERLGVTVVVKNFGSGSSGPLSGRLRTDSAYVARYDSVATWPSLGLLVESECTPAFSMSIDPIRNNAARIVITDGYGRKTRHDFTLERPDTPGSITTNTTLGADIIALSWIPATALDTRGYNVYRSLSPAGPFIRANKDVVIGTSYFADTGLNQLTTYYYKVGTVDQSGVPSLLSTIVSRSTAPAEATNFPRSFAGETSGPLAVGDVDGDGQQEIVVASGQVFVWHANGEELRDGDGDSQTLGNFTEFAPGAVLQPAAVTLADLDNVPGMEMIISERAPTLKIHAYTKTGAEAPGWPRSLDLPSGSGWNWAAPAVGDIDGDHRPEVVVNTLNGVVWAWNADGTEVRDGDANPATNGVFYVRDGATWEWTRSGPTLFDLDGDGALEIIFGTKNDSSGLKRLMALKYDGTFPAGFPYVTNGPINDDIAIGDLDGDGLKELVFYCKNRYVYAVRQNGTNYPGFPKFTGLAATDEWVGSPALGDVDGDGQLEIIYTPNETGLLSKLVVLDTNYAGGTSGQFLAGWPVALPGSSEGSPVVGDIDGDGSPEILHGIGGGNAAAPYNLYAYHANGQPVSGFPITLEGPLMPGVTITDLDKDGDVDIVYAGWDFLCHVWDMPFAYDRTDVPWPTYKANMQRTGVYFPIELVGTPDGPAVPRAGLQLDRPYPNPFNPSAKFNLYVEARGELTVDIYDVRGQRIRALHEGVIEGGWHTMVWDGRDDTGRAQPSGVYLVRARAAGQEGIQKMTLVK